MNGEDAGDASGTSRRAFVARTAAIGAGLLAGPGWMRCVTAAGAVEVPADFPAGLTLTRETYRNWAQELTVPGVLTCSPRNAQDVVDLAQWAQRNHYRLRARGAMHGWSPTMIAPGQDAVRAILLDTTRHLTAMELLDQRTLRVQAGATMDAVLGLLEAHGLGLAACPAPGDITVGGALAINAHGTAIPAEGEQRSDGQTFGSLSNRIVALSAVVWDAGTERFVLRRYERDDPQIGPLLVHLGRIFVVEVELRVGADVNLRCLSRTDIPAGELFAAPGSSGNLLSGFVQDAGRVEAIWYPYTDRPWLKVWSVSPEQPGPSRAVSAPYNYVFSDNIPEQVSDLAKAIVNGQTSASPQFSAVAQGVSAAGLVATQTSDIWGPSKNLLLYIKPTTIRATANGYAVLCARADIQWVVSEFAAFFARHLDEYRAEDRYPVSVAVEIRITGLDDPQESDVPGAQPAQLSALRPRADHPEWDVAVWLDVLAFAGQRDSQPFYRDLERWSFEHFTEPRAMVRAEWSKGWAYDGQAGWADGEVIERRVPRSFTTGYAKDANWEHAVRSLSALDPHGVFTSAFLDRLLTPRATSHHHRHRRARR